MDYKEKLRLAKEALDSGSYDKETIEYIFPELKENDDEKIRKFISHELACLRATDEKGSDRYEELTNAIAWLEKQGEQKPVDKVEHKFKVGDTVTVKPMSCHGKVFKGEPFKIVDIIEDNYVSDDGKTYSISLQDGWELVEQKPTEWSEEDEVMLDEIIDFFENGTVKLQHDLSLYASWLKSFKDRYTWKPSDEQMNILNEILNFAANRENPHWNDYIFGTLYNLIGQLKKLRKGKL